MKTFHVKVEGRVQGVFFRDFTRREAVSKNITGWVKNMADGSVEALIQGEEAALSDMLDWFHKGSPHSKVTKVTFDERSDGEQFSSFQIVF